MRARARASRHLALEVSAAFRRGHLTRRIPSVETLQMMLEDADAGERKTILGHVLSGAALGPGEAVPGCGCPDCTGIPENHPAREIRRPFRWDDDWERKVGKARSRPLLDVARGLGMHPQKTGREYMCRCPFHEDNTPSFSLSPDKDLWHCFSCGRGGDGIGLFQAVRRIGFVEAVKELAA